MRCEIIKQKWQGISLVIWAAATAATIFFIRGREFTVTGGIIMILSVPFSIFGFSELLEKFRKEMPGYANWGHILYLFGGVV